MTATVLIVIILAVLVALWFIGGRLNTWYEKCGRRIAMSEPVTREWPRPGPSVEIFRDYRGFHLRGLTAEGDRFLDGLTPEQMKDIEMIRALAYTSGSILRDYEHVEDCA